MNILLVDDEPLDRELLRARLEAAGCEVLEAADGLQALELLANTRVDAVVSDLFMPHMDGYRLCYEMKRDSRLQAIPVIVCSNAYTSEDDEQFAAKLGADKYLRKPVAPDAVFAAVRSIQSNPTPQQPGPLLENELEMMTHYSERLLAKLERQHSQLLRQTEELRASREELRALAAHLQTARENEAIRIAREVHDGLGQALTALNIDVSWLSSRISRLSDEPLRTELSKRLHTMSGLLASTVQTVQRISAELRPGMLDDLGLVATLEWHAEEFTARTGVQCVWLEKPETVSLDRDKATAVFRIFQEILTNIARHAAATTVKIILRPDGEALLLEVADDGKGFKEMRTGRVTSLGLLGMRERALAAGGNVEISSTPGKGAKVRMRVPYRPETRDSA